VRHLKNIEYVIDLKKDEKIDLRKLYFFEFLKRAFTTTEKQQLEKKFKETLGNRILETNRTYNSNYECDFIFKIQVAGKSGVGKSRLVLRYAENVYYDSYVCTIMVDFKIKTETMFDCIIKNQVWDLGHNNIYHLHKRPLYYRNCIALIYCIDLTDLTSIDDLESFFEDIPSEIIRILVGCKNDLENEIQITPSHINKICNKYRGLRYFPTSSKTGFNVNSVFEYIMAKGLNNIADSTFIPTIHTKPATSTVPKSNQSSCSLQ